MGERNKPWLWTPGFFLLLGIAIEASLNGSGLRRVSHIKYTYYFGDSIALPSEPRIDLV
jgi:hypothetical protein